MITDERKEELKELLYTWRDLTAAGASLELDCEELYFLLDVEYNRPPPRISVIKRLTRMITTRCSDAERANEDNSTI